MYRIALLIAATVTGFSMVNVWFMAHWVYWEPGLLQAPICRNLLGALGSRGAEKSLGLFSEVKPTNLLWDAKKELTEGRYGPIVLNVEATNQKNTP